MVCAGSLGTGAIAAHVTAASATPGPGTGAPASVVVEDESPPDLSVDFVPERGIADSTRTEPSTPRAPLAGGAGADAVPSDPSALGDGLVVTGRTAHRLILFTFDDGPDNRYTRRLLDALDEADIRAVFFLTAGRLEGTTPWATLNAEIARETARRGHFIASHGRDHVPLTRISGDALEGEVDGADEALFSTLGLRPRLFRPPGGAHSPRTDAYLAGRGYTTVLWNLGTGDAQVDTPEEVVDTFRRVLAWREREEGTRGGIVLLHDIHRWSLEAFPRIVALLDARNCELLARGEELYDFVEDPSIFVVARPEGASPSDEAPALVLSGDVLARRQERARARAEARCETTLASR